MLFKLFYQLYNLVAMLSVYRWIRAGGRNESLMFLCVKKIVMTGGKTARMNSPARVTGTQDGTGVQACSPAHRCPHNPLLQHKLTD